MAGTPTPTPTPTPPAPPPPPPPPPSPPAPPAPAPAGYPVQQTVLSQYQNSPILQQLVDDFRAWIDPTIRFNDFYNLVWNIDSAQGWGLDVWGRILGVSRLLHVPIAGDYLGFDQMGDADTFDHGGFYRGVNLTENFYLSDDVFRRVLLAKALANISDGSIPSINHILLTLFPDSGGPYVIDNLDMTMTYRFPYALSATDLTIAEQSGVLPKPAGVSVTYHVGP